MSNQYNTILQLTSQHLSESEQQRLLNDFADALGWRPSDRFSAPQVDEIASAHLVVEHGLENTAVLSFLRSPREYSNLTFSEKNKLLSISYNNLVDWHLPIGATEACIVYNRVSPVDSASIIDAYRVTQTDVDRLRSELFEEVIGKRPNPNLPALDNALINTISGWKRKLSADMGDLASNEALSALFNGIMFARAVEDHNKRLLTARNPDGQMYASRLLLKTLEESNGSSLPIRRVIRLTISRLIGEENIPDYLIHERQLKVFDNLDNQTLYTLISDFYRNERVPYEYDFSVMSKHALSRIYEHYVSILRSVESPKRAQLAMFPLLPEEEKSKAYGSVYTPQFVARFFAKFLKEQTLPRQFMHARAADPACGSGIFLRTLLELRFESTQRGVTTNLIQEAVENVFGLDVDVNACQATQLSLALLYQVFTNRFPQKLNVKTGEAIEYFQKNPRLKNSQDAIIANPPFVARETQTPALRERISEFMAKYASGRIDAYLPFLRIGIEMLKPGGFGMFVLPHSFLLAKSANKMREEIAKKCWIYCLADLSAIRVFGETGSYVILLIFQKKTSASQEAPAATIVRCQDYVGRALQDALDHNLTETAAYSVYEVEQDVFSENEWTIVPPTETTLQRKFEHLPVVDDFLHVHQGFITGADEVFIIPGNEVPEGEESIFVPYLPDRGMKTYVIPEHTNQYVFYPYLNGHYIEEGELRRRYPQTWKYLLSHKEELSKRSPVRNDNLSWWKPVRPRAPERMMRPKIVSPHLVIVPRFSLDVEGTYAISRSPLLYPKHTGAENDLLRFFVAVLNSRACYWHISTHSHVYRKGYAMLEPKTLKMTPVPDPAQVSVKTMSYILSLVDKRMISSGSRAVEIERQIDEIVADLYDLSSQERRALGMEV